MSKNYKFALLFVTLFFASAAIVNLFLVKNRLDFIHYGTHFKQIDSEFEYTIQPDFDNLNIIILTFKNPGIVNDKNFVFNVKDGSGILRSINFSGKNVGDPGDVRFQFEPISDSRGKDLSVNIVSNDYSFPISINVDENEIPAYRSYYRTSSYGDSLRRFVSFWTKAVSLDFVFFAVWGLILISILWIGERN
jgi:hypothetical protein